MEIKFTSRGVELPPKARDYCQRRLQSLEKKLDSLMDVNIVYTMEKYRHRVELKLKWKGGLVTTEAETEDMMASFGEAFDQLEKRLKKEKEKQREKKRRAGKSREASSLEIESSSPARRIILSHDFSLKPMCLEEAILQLEAKRREVFLFLDQASGNWHVLYRRKDGHYGLIKPE
ncbi:MAG: ribosome-associated translation inhibitor RaiA [Candidatus Aminicenantes bacterium]|nr:MAG: ribosome-associated translation inhibitor RaiA [Candidatus Aminicenantes bacterium]